MQSRGSGGSRPPNRGLAVGRHHPSLRQVPAPHPPSGATSRASAGTPLPGVWLQASRMLNTPCKQVCWSVLLQAGQLPAPAEDYRLQPWHLGKFTQLHSMSTYRAADKKDNLPFIISYNILEFWWYIYCEAIPKVAYISATFHHLLPQILTSSLLSSHPLFLLQTFQEFETQPCSTLGPSPFLLTVIASHYTTH